MSDRSLPPYWEVRESKDYPGRCYYFNIMTKESTWIRPVNEKRSLAYIAHIIKKHDKSLNPQGRSGPITRTKEEAKAELEKLREILLQDLSKFGEIANSESDTKDATANGVVGWVTKRDIPYNLASIFSLKVGELSPVMESPLGFHLVLRQA